MSASVMRIELASRRRHALVLEAEGFRVEGGFALRRGARYRDVWGLERAGSRLWVGAGLFPLGLGGRGVADATLAGAAAALRGRVAALPDGRARLGRLDRRRHARARVPWLTAALGLGLAVRAPETGTDLLHCLSLGLLAEGWLGRGPTLVAGAATLLAAAAIAAPAEGAALARLVVTALPAGLLGLLAFARSVREAALSVRQRCALDLTAPLALAFFASLGVAGASPWPPGAAAVAGFVVAPLALGRLRTR